MQFVKSRLPCLPDPPRHVEVESTVGAYVVPDQRCETAPVRRRHARHPGWLGEHALKHQRIGQNVVETWNGANGFIFFGKGGEVTSTSDQIARSAYWSI